VIEGNGWQVHHGDSRQILAELAPESIDSIVCDPPYELGFMGKGWDSSGIAYDPELWAAAYRVLKPGGHLLAFGGSRTYHRLAVAVEDAGFEIRDMIEWVYGSGFPKSLDVSKAIDAAAGAERQVVAGGSARCAWVDRGEPCPGHGDERSQSGLTVHTQATVPATPDAERWDGWGTALKPAHEPVVMARKPLAGTVIATVLEYGTGALNIDAGRIESGGTHSSASSAGAGSGQPAAGVPFAGGVISAPHPGGRWPPNMVFTHDVGCSAEGGCMDSCPVGLLDEQSGETVSSPATRRNAAQATSRARLGDGAYDSGGHDDEGGASRFFPAFDWSSEADGVARGPAYGAHEDTGGNTIYGKGLASATPNQPPYEDDGGASRFFPAFDWHSEADAQSFRYEAKPNRYERELGLEAMPELEAAATWGDLGAVEGNPRKPATGHVQKVRNHHPTVKPVAVMRWLARLVTPPGGTVLDPFCGSGTTGVAALIEGFRFVGCELTAEYLPLIEGRLRWAEGRKGMEMPTRPAPPKAAAEGQTSLFDL
jgi:site-specific DNA-methyltransferase (adenine-specific)